MGTESHRHDAASLAKRPGVHPDAAGKTPSLIAAADKVLQVLGSAGVAAGEHGTSLIAEPPEQQGVCLKFAIAEARSRERIHSSSCTRESGRSGRQPQAGVGLTRFTSKSARAMTHGMTAGAA